MPHRILLAALTICSLTTSELAADMPTSPYAGQQNRPVKALSPEDIAALRNGEGMGMAKAAELNGYPGPAHVLALEAIGEVLVEEPAKAQVEGPNDGFDEAALSAVGGYRFAPATLEGLAVRVRIRWAVEFRLD